MSTMGEKVVRGSKQVRVTFIVENGSVRIINSAVYAIQKFQEQMKGQAALAGFASEEDIAEWITNSRREENAE